MYQVIHQDNVQSRYTRRDPLELLEWKNILGAPDECWRLEPENTGPLTALTELQLETIMASDEPFVKL